MIRKDLKTSSQCVKIVKNANQTLSMIKRTFTFKTKDNLLQLYNCLVRPHLEYCMQVWNPYLKKDIDLLEGVQRRAIHMILGYKHNCDLFKILLLLFQSNTNLLLLSTAFRLWHAVYHLKSYLNDFSLNLKSKVIALYSPCATNTRRCCRLALISDERLVKTGRSGRSRESREGREITEGKKE